MVRKTKVLYQVKGDTYNVFDVPIKDKSFVKSLKEEGYPLFRTKKKTMQYQNKVFGTYK